MYAARCPECGHPAPLSVASPDRLRCPACHYDGPPPPAIAEQLHRAAALLSQQDARQRQLSGLQRRVISSGVFGTAVYLAALFLALSPFALCLFFWTLGASGGERVDWRGAFMCATPVLLVGAFGVSGLLFLRRQIAKLRACLAAFPPPAPGEPAGCYVCGGPIPTHEGVAFVRCPYCAADNLVDPKLLATLGVRREAILDGFERDIGHRSEIARQALRSSLRGLALGAVLALPVTFGLSCLLSFVLTQVETEPDDELEYALVESPAGRCVARVTPYDGHPDWMRLEPGGWLGAAPFAPARPRAIVSTLRARELVGLRVRSVERSEHDLTVVRALGTALSGRNRLELRADDGAVRHAPVTEVCLVEGAVSPVPPVPLVEEATSP